MAGPWRPEAVAVSEPCFRAIGQKAGAEICVCPWCRVVQVQEQAALAPPASGSLPRAPPWGPPGVCVLSLENKQTTGL